MCRGNSLRTFTIKWGEYATPVPLRRAWRRSEADGKMRRKLVREASKSNLKAAVGISAKFWPQTTCDKYILHMFGLQGKCGEME